MFTKDRTVNYLKAREYPDVFLSIFLEKTVPENLDIWLGVPKELYLCNDTEQAGIIPKDYEPLWDDGNFGAIYCATHFDRSIRKVYVEGGENIYGSYLEFAASIIESAWEAEFDELLPEWASALNFPWLKEAVEFLNSKDDSASYDEHEKNYYALIKNLERQNA
ncbi:hypothetical protein ACJJIF_13345 [Microbulbifer sp. SSSA002]|uniref:hypothetical protein n=1 Tax=Microbulbifer sp. SSSA002 TaxID=3243376 RepID=UPI0040395B17